MESQIDMKLQMNYLQKDNWALLTCWVLLTRHINFCTCNLRKFKALSLLRFNKYSWGFGADCEPSPVVVLGGKAVKLIEVVSLEY